MALSFADWEKQLATDYAKQQGQAYADAVAAGPPPGWDPEHAWAPSGLAVDPKGNLDSVIAQLTGKLNNQASALQAAYQKGLTPEQVLFGQTGQAPTTTGNRDPYSSDPTLQNLSWLFNPNRLKDPNALGYDPSRGLFSSPANMKFGGWDKFGQFLPMIIATLLTGGMGAAIGAVGGASGLLGGGSLLKIPQLSQTIGNLLGGNQGQGG